MKFKIRVDAGTQAVWATVQNAKEEVANWPEWKRSRLTQNVSSHQQPLSPQTLSNSSKVAV